MRGDILFSFSQLYMQCKVNYFQQLSFRCRSFFLNASFYGDPSYNYRMDRVLLIDTFAYIVCIFSCLTAKYIGSNFLS